MWSKIRRTNGDIEALADTRRALKKYVFVRSFPDIESLNFGLILKAALAIQMWPSWPYKPLSFQTLRHSQFLTNSQSPKFKFSSSGKWNARLFVDMAKTISIFWQKRTFEELKTRKKLFLDFLTFTKTWFEKSYRYV